MSNEVNIVLKLKENVADGLRRITVQSEGLDQAIQNVTASTVEASDKLRDMAAMNLSMQAFADMVGRLDGTIRQLAEGYDSFDKAMRSVNTMAGKNAEGLAAMTGQVQQLAGHIPLAREALAGGLYQTISNGVPEDNWISFLEQSARSAVGGLAELDSVVTVTSTLIKNYGLEWEAAAAIQDRIQTAAQLGVTSFEQMAAALPRVTGQAASLGVSIDELMSTFATLTGVSGNTAEVSTQLAAVFTALIKPSSEAAKQAELMGIQFDAVAVRAAGGLMPFLDQLSNRIDQYCTDTGALRQTVMANLFGSAEALRALIPLTGELTDKFHENTAAMAASAGTIDRAFTEMSSTGEATSQMLRNQLSVITDWVGRVASAAAPWVSMAANVGIFLATAGTTITTLRTMTGALTASRAAQLLSTAATTAASAATRLHNTLLTALTAKLHSARLATVALASIYTLGLAVAIEAICQLFLRQKDSNEQANEAMQRTAETTRRLQEVQVATGGQLTALTAKVRAYIDSGADETIMVSQLNQQYGHIFGTYKTLAQWYDTLTAKSHLYVQMKTNEAAIEMKAAEAARLQAEIKSLQGMKVSEPTLEDYVGPFNERIWNQGIEQQLAEKNTALAALTAELDTIAKKNLDLQAQLAQGLTVTTPTVTPQPAARPLKVPAEFELTPMQGLPQLGVPENLEATITLNTDPAQQAADEYTRRLDTLRTAQQQAQAAAQQTQQGISSLGNIFGTIAGMADGAAASILSWAASTLQAIAQAIPQIVALTAATTAEANANSAAAVTGAAKSVAWAGPVAAVAAIASVVAALATIPKFAQGGLAYGPTLGLFGEYPGAAGNPEVVAPLSRLKSLLGDTPQGPGGDIRFRISGTDLIAIYNKVGRRNQRTA